MRITLSTGTFYHRSIAYCLRVARAAGCDGVELVFGLGYTLRGLAPIERAVARSGVPVLSVHPPLYPLPGWPQTMEERVRRVIGAAQRLSAPICVFHPGMYASPASPRAQQYTAVMAQGQRDAGTAVQLTIENNQVTGRHHRWVLDDLDTLARFAQDGGYGITLDTCHIGANGQDLLATYELVRPLLRNIHLSDMRWQHGQPKTHLLPGEGTLPLNTLLTRLADDGYNGLITLELSPLEVGLWGRERAVRRVARAVAFVRNAMGAATRPARSPC
jgi:sugar phosphate isomerase/epimerase